MYANKKRCEVEFQQGDKPYHVKTLARKLNQKLSARFYGPYEVLERIGKVAYKLKLPNSTHVHPVFHVSLLKKCIKPDTSTQLLPYALTADWQLLVEPAQVLARQQNTVGQYEVLIQWKDLPEFENSWELASDIQHYFPSFHLTDKVNLEGAGIVTSIENLEKN